MPNLNKVTLIGHVGKDPETKTFSSSKSVTKTSLAVSSKYNGVEETEWFNLVFWDKLGETVQDYVKKGSPIYVEGRQKTNKWEGQDGVTRYRQEIICNQMQLLGGKQVSNDYRPSQNAIQSPMASEVELNDDLPF